MTARLLAAAKLNFRLDRPHEDGTTDRQHLEAFERKTGERPEELDQCRIPKGARHIWAWFWELNATRTGSGFGPNPIQFSDIEAWGRLKGVSIRGYEFDAIRMLDSLFLAETNREKKQLSSRQGREK